MLCHDCADDGGGGGHEDGDDHGHSDDDNYAHDVSGLVADDDMDAGDHIATS